MALDKITTGIIADDAVTAAKIVAGAVGTSEIADGTVVAADIAADAVGTTELANDVTISTSGNIATTGSGTLTVAGTSTLTGNATASGNLTVTGDIVPSTPLSNRNMIINGGMQVWQRATAANDNSGGYFTVDRWNFVRNTNSPSKFTSEKHTMSNVDKGLTGHGTALKLVVTGGADTDMTTNQYAYFFQRIEAQNLQHILYGTAQAKTLTLSFWVKSNLTGTYVVDIKKADSTQYHCPIEYAISSADTWEQKKITITPTAGSTSLITAGTGEIVNDNGEGMQISFGLAWGTDYHGTNNTWATGSGFATSNQVNWMGTLANNFYLTGVQLELGSNATPFEHRSYGDELERCYRYCQHHNALSIYTAFARGAGLSTTSAEFVLPYIVTMTQPPTVTGNVLGLSDGVNSIVAVTSVGSIFASTHGTNVTAYTSGGLTQYRPYALIANSNDAAYIQLVSEL